MREKQFIDDRLEDFDLAVAEYDGAVGSHQKVRNFRSLLEDFKSTVREFLRFCKDRAELEELQDAIRVQMRNDVLKYIFELRNEQIHADERDDPQLIKPQQSWAQIEGGIHVGAGASLIIESLNINGEELGRIEAKPTNRSPNVEQFGGSRSVKLKYVAGEITVPARVKNRNGNEISLPQLFEGKADPAGEIVAFIGEFVERYIRPSV